MSTDKLWVCRQCGHRDATVEESDGHTGPYGGRCATLIDLAALWELYGCRDFPVERLTDPAMRFAIVSPADQTIVYATTDDPADGHTVDHGKAKLWESAADALRLCESAHTRDGLTSADDPWYMVEPVEDVAEFRARPPTW